MSGLNKAASPVVTPAAEERDGGRRFFWCVGLGAVSIVLIAVVPWLLTYGGSARLYFNDPLPEYLLRIPLFLLLAVLAWRLIPPRFTSGLRDVPKRIVPQGRKAVVFVHGMGVQDKDEMVTDVSDGLEAFGDGVQVAGRTFNIEKDPSQQIIHDEITLFVDDGLGQAYRLDCYEAYWGSLFNGCCKWQSAGLFGLGAVMKALQDLLDVVRKKRAMELLQAGMAILVVCGCLLLIASGTRVAMKFINNTSVNAPVDKSGDPLSENVKVAELRLNFAGRVIETGAFIAKSFYEIPKAWEELFHEGGIVKMSDLKKVWEKQPTSAILIALVYSVAWAYMLYSLFGALAHIAGMRLAFRDKRGARGRIYTRQWKTLAGLLNAGLSATFVYILLDPLFSMPLVRLAVCLSLLYLLVWVIKYWLTNFLGDVQIFVNSNANSSFYKVREAAVDFVAQRISEIAARTDPATLKLLYDEVYVIGHSLGSAVAVSALRRVADQHSLDPNHPRLPQRIRAYITIGSPLRKIRKFYKAQPYKRYTVEYAYETDVEIFGEDSIDATKTRWHNFWYWSDLFADQLSMIDPIEDRSYFTILPTDDVRLHSPKVLWSHSSYWNDPEWVGRVLLLMSS